MTAKNQEPPFPPAMLVGIAAGLEDPELVAAKFGYTPESYREIATTPAFKTALANIVRQMQEEGLTPAMVEHASLQEMLAKVTSELYATFMSSTLEPADKAKIAALLYRREESLTTRSKPKQEDEGGSESFTINISIPSPAVGAPPQGVVIDVPTKQKPSLPELDMPTINEMLGDLPEDV